MMDVYQKIRKAKMEENITIDASFKASLREKIMAQALAFPPQKPFHDFFRKWRYSLALVPTFLLMVIVALQSTHLPVTIPSKTLNPDASQDAETSFVASQEQTSQSAAIQTFAGSSVMPKNYNVPVSDEFSKPTSFEALSNEATPSPTNIQQKTLPPSAQTSSSKSNGPSLPQPLPVNSPFQPSTSNPIPSTSQPAANTSPDNLSSQNAPNFQADVVPQNSTLSNQSMKMSLNPAINSSSQQTLSSSSTQQLQTTAPLPSATSLSAFAFPVLYQGTFSNDEKTLINQTLIVPLTNGKSVQSVSVRENRTTNILSIQLLLSNGTSQNFSYQKNNYTQQWSQVLAP